MPFYRVIDGETLADLMRGAVDGVCVKSTRRKMYPFFFVRFVHSHSHIRLRASRQFDRMFARLLESELVGMGHMPIDSLRRFSICDPKDCCN